MLGFQIKLNIWGLIVKICKRCDKLLFDWRSGDCDCKPFKIIDSEIGEIGEIVYGDGFENVIERLAKNQNSYDPIFDQDIFEDHITLEDGDGERKTFNCQAEIDVNYNVYEVTNDNKSNKSE